MVQLRCPDTLAVFVRHHGTYSAQRDRRRLTTHRPLWSTVHAASEKATRQSLMLPDRSKSSMPDLSVVIVTYNSASVVSDCLRSVTEHMPEVEIVVVDNGSDDGTVALVGRNPQVCVVKGHGNVGFGAGVNLGARAASGRLLFVLNPDASLVGVDRGQLENLRRDPVTGLVGCRVRSQKLTYHHLKFAAWGWKAELYWALSQYFLVPCEISVMRPRLAGRHRRQWIAGAAFVVARHEFLEVGGFDDQIFLYFEDFDLSRTYSAHGLPIRTTEAITVAHIGQQSSPQDECTMIGYACLGLIEYVHKWEGSDAARDAASRCLRVLAAIELIGRACGGVPLLGPRAKRKRESAFTVRSWLVAAATQPPVPNAYAAAAAALRRALPNDAI